VWVWLWVVVVWMRMGGVQEELEQRVSRALLVLRLVWVSTLWSEEIVWVVGRR